MDAEDLGPRVDVGLAAHQLRAGIPAVGLAGREEHERERGSGDGGPSARETFELGMREQSDQTPPRRLRSMATASGASASHGAAASDEAQPQPFFVGVVVASPGAQETGALPAG